MGKDIATLTLDTFSDLRGILGVSHSSVKVLGKDTVNDGFGGVFYWEPASTDTDDNLNTIQKIGTVTGRWIRLSESATDTSLGNTNLTLTDNRSVNGNNKGLLFSNLSDLSFYSNNFVFSNQSNGSFTFSGNTGVCILDVSLLSGSSKNLSLPNENGIIATQGYVTTSTSSTLTAANNYTDTQIGIVNTSLNGYIKRETTATYADINISGPEAIIVVQTDENNSGNRGLYYRNTGKIDWIIAQPFNY